MMRMEEMRARARTLLRLHVEAVWSVRLPHFLDEECKLLPASIEPSWKLCAAQLADERILIWRPSTTAAERKALRARVDEALDFSSLSRVSSIHREVALALAAAPSLDLALAANIARPLTEQDEPAL